MDWEKRKKLAKDSLFFFEFLILYKIKGMKVAYKGGW